MKKVFVSCIAILFLAFALPAATPATANDYIAVSQQQNAAPVPVAVSLDQALGIKAPARQKLNMSVPESKKYAQLRGGVCRLGIYWCSDGASWGYVGTPCCGCGFCGLWSLN